MEHRLALKVFEFLWSTWARSALAQEDPLLTVVEPLRSGLWQGEQNPPCHQELGLKIPKNCPKLIKYSQSIYSRSPNSNSPPFQPNPTNFTAQPPVVPGRHRAGPSRPRPRLHATVDSSRAPRDGERQKGLARTLPTLRLGCFLRGLFRSL